MITKAQEERLKRFANDQATLEAVYEVIRMTFLKTRNPHAALYPTNDLLAAERVAADLFELAWKEIVKFKHKDEEVKEPKQIGL